MNKRKHNATQAVINLAEEHGNETAAVLDQQRKKTKIPMATGNIHSFLTRLFQSLWAALKKSCKWFLCSVTIDFQSNSR